MKKFFRVFLSVIAVILAVALLTVGGYVIYLYASFHRAGNQPLEVTNVASDKIEEGKEYKIVSYNVGFGAYESDYGFFMDGGKESRAWSQTRLDINLKKITTLLKEQNADFYFVQEVDTDSTRTYSVDERTYFTLALANKSYVFAQNFDSAYLFYPILCPHGIARSGIMTFSGYQIDSSKRVELPIETGFSKFFDLDRCYSKSILPTASGKTVVMYNFHLSAYTSDGTIANEQLKLLIADMEEEYKRGSYCIAGGDFNKDILGDSSVYFGKSDKEYTWAQPIPKEVLEGKDIELVAPLDKANPVPTCRNADGPYHEGQFVLTIDGFLVSPNVEVKSAAVIDTKFEYSDHNPVEMIFELK